MNVSRFPEKKVARDDKLVLFFAMLAETRGNPNMHFVAIYASNESCSHIL